MKGKGRLPVKHITLVRDIARALGGQPRYAVARALVERLRHTEPISMQTALDYVLAAVNEGHLQRVGFNLIPGGD